MGNILESFWASSFTTCCDLHPINVHKSSDLPASWLTADLGEMNNDGNHLRHTSCLSGHVRSLDLLTTVMQKDGLPL